MEKDSFTISGTDFKKKYNGPYYSIQRSWARFLASRESSSVNLKCIFIGNQVYKNFSSKTNIIHFIEIPDDTVIKVYHMKEPMRINFYECDKYNIKHSKSVRDFILMDVKRAIENTSFLSRYLDEKDMTPWVCLTLVSHDPANLVDIPESKWSYDLLKIFTKGVLELSIF